MFEPINIGFMDLQEHHCRDVVGKGEDGLATYCGHDKKPGSSYCPFHANINELPAPPRKPVVYFRLPGRAA